MQKLTHQIRNSEYHLTPGELARLIGGGKSERDRLIVEVLAYTAIRRAELRMLQIEDIDAARNRFIIQRGKGGKQRTVFAPPRLTDAIMQFATAHGSKHVFPGRSGGPMSLRNINYIVSRVGSDAGVATPNPRYVAVGPHLLRHSFARNWKRCGGSIESLQKILGHASVKTTWDCYGTEDQKEVEANYRGLEQSLVTS